MNKRSNMGQVERNKGNLGRESGVTSGIMACYLEEESARVTNHTFKVSIPSVMSSVEAGTEEVPATIDTTTCLNSRNMATPQVTTQNFIEGRNCTTYGHRIDGWIPEFTIERLTAEWGTVEKLESSSTKVTSDPGSCPGGGPHTHSVSMGTVLSGSRLDDIVFHKLVAYVSEGVDFQELHRKYIKKGHKMYGTFVEGSQTDFIIIAMDNVTPYLTEAEDNGTNDDNPDTSFDNGETNVPNGG